MSGFTDTKIDVRAIGARTDKVGTAVTDMSAEEERFANIFVSEGWIAPTDAFEPVAATSWNINLGSGTTDTDYYVVEGLGVGQGHYVVRLDQAGDIVSIDAADLSNPRYDEIYVIVQDDAYDSTGITAARFAVRRGDAGPSPLVPGPDNTWLAYALLAQVYVPAGASSIAECTVYDSRVQSQSNADAPTLTGLASSAFATSTHDHDATYAPLSHEGATSGHPTATAGTSGFMSAAEKAKLNAIETGAEANMSATELRTELWFVDGAGSGLDADLLDSAHASAYAQAGHVHDADYYIESEMNTKLNAKANNPQQVWIGRANTPISTSSGVETAPLLGTEWYDDWGGHSGTSNQIYDHLSGYYLVEAQVVFTANSGGTIRQIRLWESSEGSYAYGRERPVNGSDTSVVNASMLVHLNGSERVGMWIYQDSGSSLSYQVGYNGTWLRLTYLGG